MSWAHGVIGDHLADGGITAATIPICDCAVSLVEVTAELEERIHPEVVGQQSARVARLLAIINSAVKQNTRTRTFIIVF